MSVSYWCFYEINLHREGVKRLDWGAYQAIKIAWPIFHFGDTRHSVLLEFMNAQLKTCSLLRVFLTWKPKIWPLLSSSFSIDLLMLHTHIITDASSQIPHCVIFIFTMLFRDLKSELMCGLTLIGCLRA